MYKTDGRKVIPIKTNLNEKFELPTDILVDKNENIWITSRVKGLYKVEISAFTSDNYFKELTMPDIVFYSEANDSVVIFTRDQNSLTYVGFKNQPNSFKKYPLQIYNHVVFEGKNLFSTQNGIYVLEDNKLALWNTNFYGTSSYLNKISDKELWIFANQENGRYSYTKQNGLKHLSNKFPNELPKVIYADAGTKNHHFFGGVGCAYLFDKQSRKWINYKDSLSVVDLEESFLRAESDNRNIIWIMSPNAIVGIKDNLAPIVINDLSWLKSRNIYDFKVTEDDNLIIGTVNGIVT